MRATTTAHGQHASILDGVIPHLRQIQRRADVGIFHLDGGGGGNGQHAELRLSGDHEGGDLVGGLPLDGHILAGVRPLCSSR